MSTNEATTATAAIHEALDVRSTVAPPWSFQSRNDLSRSFARSLALRNTAFRLVSFDVHARRRPLQRVVSRYELRLRTPA